MIIPGLVTSSLPILQEKNDYTRSYSILAQKCRETDSNEYEYYIFCRNFLNSRKIRI